MATYNDSNANFVNLQALPQIQSITDGNYIIISTPSGVRLIDWANINVPTLTQSGGVSFTDTITAVNIDSQSALVQYLSVNGITTNNTPTISQLFNYYNRFTITNGLITSADYVVGSSEYNNLFSLINTVSTNNTSTINSVSTYLTQTQPNVYQAYATLVFNVGQTWSSIVQFNTDPINNINNPPPNGIINFYPSDFTFGYTLNTISSTKSLSCIPSLSAVGITARGYLSASIVLNNPNTTGGNISIEARVLKYY